MHGLSAENLPFFDYARAFSRNLGLVSENEQQLLSSKRIALPGCGGVGSLHALILARLGIGNFVLADFDSFEIENFNRQFGAKISTLGRPKDQVVAEEINQINPRAETRLLGRAISPESVDSFLEGVDLVVDGLDFFAFDARRLLFTRARERGIPLLTAAPLGFSCALLLFTPEGMSSEEYFGFKDDDDRLTLGLKFALGLAPRSLHLPYVDRSRINLEKGQGPSSSIGVALCAAMAGGQAVRCLLGRGGLRPAPYFAQFDAYRGKYTEGILRRGHRHPLQRLKLWYAKRLIGKRA
jgi:molybdopterin/thiamine biosynthesis adenylyltransferase